jgi:predicted DNA-binding WGR domain protein
MHDIDLEKRIPRENMFRFYRLSVLPNLFGEWTLARQWGRIGTRGRSRLDWFKTQFEAEMALHKLKAFRTRRGYQTKPEQLSLF